MAEHGIFYIREIRSNGGKEREPSGVFNEIPSREWSPAGWGEFVLAKENSPYLEAITAKIVGIGTTLTIEFSRADYTYNIQIPKNDEMLFGDKKYNMRNVAHGIFIEPQTTIRVGFMRRTEYLLKLIKNDVPISEIKLVAK